MFLQKNLIYVVSNVILNPQHTVVVLSPESGVRSKIYRRYNDMTVFFHGEEGFGNRHRHHGVYHFATYLF